MGVCAVDGCKQPARSRGWCNVHYLLWYRTGDPHRRPSLTFEERFWKRVNRNGPVPVDRPDLGPCWLWLGSTTGAGYGRTSRDGRDIYAHRVSYEIEVGRIPADLQLDHICRIIRCVNPTHLEPVTCRVNLLRGRTVTARNAAVTECPEGHPYDVANTYVTSNGWRQCKICRRRRDRSRGRSQRSRLQPTD